jgi:hypothetical protein
LSAWTSCWCGPLLVGSPTLSFEAEEPGRNRAEVWIRGQGSRRRGHVVARTTIQRAPQTQASPPRRRDRRTRGARALACSVFPRQLAKSGAPQARALAAAICSPGWLGLKLEFRRAAATLGVGGARKIETPQRRAPPAHLGNSPPSASDATGS